MYSTSTYYGNYDDDCDEVKLGDDVDGNWDQGDEGWGARDASRPLGTYLFILFYFYY
jgi:hypothetical protein